jgi:hypothetical protein
MIDYRGGNGVYMPYVSGAQRGWAHTPAGTKALGGAAKVAEWDAASKGQHVPYKVGDHAVSNKGYQGKTESFAAGGPVLGRQKNWAKEGNVKNPTNTTEAHDKPNYGSLIGGVDRFTSHNLADAGEPANIQRTKPDEDWSKGKAGMIKNKRSGDSKSEAPVKPRK